MIRKISISIIGLMLALGGVLFMPLGLEIAQAETWTETTTDDFSAGETAFVDIVSGSLELARGLNRIWYDIGEASSDFFGRSIAGAGDVNGDGYDDIIAGADGNEGAGSDSGEAYVYFGSADGPSDTPDWSDQGEAAFDYFGLSLAGAGDVNGDGYDDIIVGAYYNDGGGNNAGEAYVYYGSSVGPSTSPDWSDQGEAINDLFGRSVAGAGDVNGDGYDDIIVGAYSNDGGGSNSGEAYIYFGSASGPSATPDWSDQGEAADDFFGINVAGAGDVNGDGFNDITVGAYGNDGGGTSAGEAYVYFGSSSGPSATPDWSAQGEAANDYFGVAVAGTGDVNGDGYDDISVGAEYNDGGGTNAGETYVYFGSASGPSATPDWSDQGEAINDYFGFSVAGAGDVNDDGYDDLIVGAYGNDDGGSGSGEAYIYFGSVNGPSATPDWSDQGEAVNDYYGYSVAGAGDVNGDGYSEILVGAYQNDDLALNAGKTYLYSVPAEVIFKSWSDTGEAAGDGFGISTASAGDVNSDGYDDIIVGAYKNDSAGSDAGKAYVYFGSASGPSTTPDWSDLGEAAGDWFGRSVAGAGDVNGDGYDDIIVGANLNNDGGSTAGEAYVYFGSASGPSATPDWSDQGEAAGDKFGFSVAGAGDVNGDGYDDIIIGALDNDGAAINAGEAYVYFGSASGPSATPDWSDQGEAANDFYGAPVAGIRDINSDGYEDIIVSATSNDGGGNEAGEAYVYYGSASGPSTTPDWSQQGEAGNNYFGRSAAGADINGDEYDDLIISSPYNDDAGSNVGEIYVYYGSLTGLGATPDWSAQGETANNTFGLSVAGAGDLNRDGYDDIVAGAASNADSGTYEGMAYILYGSANGLNATPAWSKQGEVILDRFGSSVAGAGDTNGDGYDGIIVGAWGNDESGNEAGKAYVYSTAQYAERGRFTSDTFSVDNNDDFFWLSIDWRPFTQPEETDVRVQIATNDDGITWDFVGPDGTANTSFTNPHGQKIPAGELGRFIKMRAYLSTTLGSITPTVTEFSINYEFQYIVDPYVVVTSPNGGEDWMKDDYYPITWNAQGDFNSTPVSLYYSTDNGANWVSIVNWTKNLGFYNWTVPNIETSDALIAVTVTDLYGNQAVDTSDASFAIDPPPGNIEGFNSPLTNTIWGAGEHPILWTLGNSVSSIDLELSLDGQTWEGIAGDLPNTGTYAWNIENGVNSKNARIRLITQDGVNGPKSITSHSFTIDTESPEINHEELTEGFAGSALYFQASVSDNFDVSSVTLYYNDGTGFRPVSMNHDNGGNSAQVVPTKEGSIEYYITAFDGANYATTDTFHIEVRSAESTDEDSNDSGEGDLPFWYIGTGIVAGVIVGITLGVVISNKKSLKENEKEQ